MVYFNDINDLKRLESALIEQKRKQEAESMDQSEQIDDNNEENISNKKKIKNI